MCVINSLVLFTMFSDKLTDKIRAKYFASWYNAVLMFEMIGRIGNSSTLTVLLFFCFFLTVKYSIIIKIFSGYLVTSNIRQLFL